MLYFSNMIHWLFKEKPFVSSQGQSTMHIQTLCSENTTFSSLVTLYNLTNLFLFNSSRIENFLNHLMASFKTSLIMSESLGMMITILESQQILHCYISQVLKLFVTGTKTTLHWNQKQIWQYLKRTLSRKSWKHMTKSVQRQTVLPVNPRNRNIKDTKPSFKSILLYPPPQPHTFTVPLKSNSLSL